MEHFLETHDRLNERQFLIAVKRLADSLSYGTDSSPFLGAGIEYVQSRLYQIGDPIKSIDWRVTARTGKIHVKEFESPRQLPVYFLIDTSASMTIRSTTISKYALAVHIAGGLAFAALDRISPVGVVGVGESSLRVTPSLSRIQVLQWLHRLRRYRMDEGTTLGKKLKQLAPSLPNRAVLMILSDMHDPEAVEALKPMAQKHDCVVLQLMDPAETGGSGAGFFRGREAETGTGFIAHGKHLWPDVNRLHDVLPKAQIDHLLLKTQEPVEYRLRRFFKMRGLAERGVR
ncbi:MAG: DUF58 domain-containing protein [Verrucomicrobiota bacterium]|nr:DUF58 domain-containing protein [Verrucomicrobiota bacterium]MDG1889989.1 DUF58 domain-containing protein [Verrucomicrobiota bacterium]